MSVEQDRVVREANDFRITAGHDGADFSFDLGAETLLLCKTFGPMIFADLRIRADASSCEWVIERACGCEQTAEGDGPVIWKEWYRIPGQMDGDFSGVYRMIP